MDRSLFREVNGPFKAINKKLIDCDYPKKWTERSPSLETTTNSAASSVIIARQAHEMCSSFSRNCDFRLLRSIQHANTERAFVVVARCVPREPN